MKVLMLTLGTRGDIQPFVALGRALRRAGHEAVLAAPRMFGDFVRGHCVPFEELADGPMGLIQNGSPVGEVAEGGIRAKMALARRMPSLFAEVLRDCWTVADAHSDADIVLHNGQVVAGQHVAEKLGKPSVLALPIPMYVPTREFPWPGADMRDTLPGWVNRLGYAAMRSTEVMFGRTVDRFRADLGLPRREGRRNPLKQPDGSPTRVLHAISEHVLPRPLDWPQTSTLTGYWFLDEQPELPSALTDFFAAGEPPVFVGFGSMSGTDPAATTRTIIDAIAKAGRRAVLSVGWGGLSADPVPDNVFVTREVPFTALFPHVSVVVHHGGAGTIATAATAGRPQVVCPYVADQPFWGRRMARLGVAPQPIRQRDLTATVLAQAITEAESYTDTAAQLGQRIQGEDGLLSAVVHLEALL